MANEISKIRKEANRKVEKSFQMPANNIRTEQGIFDGGNRWEIDLTADMLRAMGMDVDEGRTIQLFKISGTNIVNVDILSN